MEATQNTGKIVKKTVTLRIKYAMACRLSLGCLASRKSRQTVGGLMPYLFIEAQKCRTRHLAPQWKPAIQAVCVHRRSALLIQARIALTSRTCDSSAGPLRFRVLQQNSRTVYETTTRFGI